jgi:DNA-binding HxlR family transcriptional regulator
MDLARLTELESLFGRRYQALALLCLYQEGPMRWAAVARAMQRRADEHLHDKEISRSLKALETAGYVQRVNCADGTAVRALTPAGTRRAERLRDLITELDM